MLNFATESQSSYRWHHPDVAVRGIDRIDAGISFKARANAVTGNTRSSICKENCA